MAQLRDALTSALIAEGTPAEMVVIADAVGRDQVLFDGVGWDLERDEPTFDPDAVVAGAQDQLQSLQAVLAEDPPTDEQALEALERTIAEQEAVLSPPAEVVEAAQAALEAARERLPS